MTDKQKFVHDQVYGGELYTVIGLQKALFILGHPVSMEDLYIALKGTGWIKLRLIRDKLLDMKRDMPKKTPFDAIRHMIKFPLLVERNEDLPEWKKYSGSNER
jgi:hypothetical protein